MSENPIDVLLKMMVEKNASDLHLKAGSPPMLRVDGELEPAIPQVLPPNAIRKIIESMLTEQQKAKLVAERELDFAYSVPGLARFRCNAYFQRNSWALAVRIIPSRPFSIDELGLPEIFKYLAMRPRGLVLVTGPTGSGKSTTLASMIDYINANRKCHIITIEDPIEFLHKDKLAIVSQRELGTDTHSFANALRSALRQDPDVILVGELRDFETTQIAITAAETGHLVLGTLHTTGCANAVDRVIDIFPPHQQHQVRVQLSMIIEGVIFQNLIPKSTGSGRVLALEIMTGTPAVRHLIREGKTHMLPNAIQSGSEDGMISFDQSLRDLYLQGLISFEYAMLSAFNPEELERLITSSTKRK
ncbi:MAG: type IV pilus twitching motility protein PilT [Candidatus Calescibacterium sp.]|nr:type IV pilus twitching motility protein PilT [Candidatus Calescibacterium sp.]MDW8132694.1 type IV pilus twitching motility protein PilT [Candidatus Calescibacterium sp.]